MNNDIEQGRKLQESTNSQEDAEHAKKKKKKHRHHSDKRHRHHRHHHRHHHHKSRKGRGEEETIASDATVQVSNLSTKTKTMDDVMERGGIGTNIYNSTIPQQDSWDNPVEEMQPRRPPVETVKPVFNESKSYDSDDFLAPIDKENSTAGIAVAAPEASIASRHPSVTLSTNENEELHGTYDVTNGNETQVFPGMLSPFPHESVEPLQNPTQTPQPGPPNNTPQVSAGAVDPDDPRILQEELRNVLSEQQNQPNTAAPVVQAIPAAADNVPNTTVENANSTPQENVPLPLSRQSHDGSCGGKKWWILLGTIAAFLILAGVAVGLVFVFALPEPEPDPTSPPTTAPTLPTPEPTTPEMTSSPSTTPILVPTTPSPMTMTVLLMTPSPVTTTPDLDPCDPNPCLDDEVCRVESGNAICTHDPMGICCFDELSECEASVQSECSTFFYQGYGACCTGWTDSAYGGYEDCALMTMEACHSLDTVGHPFCGVGTGCDFIPEQACPTNCDWITPPNPCNPNPCSDDEFCTNLGGGQHQCTNPCLPSPCDPNELCNNLGGSQFECLSGCIPNPCGIGETCSDLGQGQHECVGDSNPNAMTRFVWYIIGWKSSGSGSHINDYTSDLGCNNPFPLVSAQCGGSGTLLLMEDWEANNHNCSVNGITPSNMTCSPQPSGLVWLACATKSTSTSTSDFHLNVTIPSKEVFCKGVEPYAWHGLFLRTFCNGNWTEHGSDTCSTYWRTPEGLRLCFDADSCTTGWDDYCYTSLSNIAVGSNGHSSGGGCIQETSTELTTKTISKMIKSKPSWKVHVP